MKEWANYELGIPLQLWPALFAGRPACFFVRPDCVLPPSNWSPVKHGF